MMWRSWKNFRMQVGQQISPDDVTFGLQGKNVAAADQPAVTILPNGVFSQFLIALRLYIRRADCGKPALTEHTEW